MIPKASQRAGGQDLATHLLNAFDNEYVEVAEVRGAVARDLHGAFAEWEAVAHALTRCRNYLYSLSVNPDLGQGPLTRAQYLDYADRVEKALGLEDQPRALVFHIKEGREHCHIVWSRIDARAGKAIHQPFDHDKLMMVTRDFARDHGLSLPAGYERGGDESTRKSLYEMQQERNSGISKEERMAAVTAAWKRSDTPRAFVRALEEMGYVLATGKRPYVLVDIYGDMNALPKMIDDKGVRTKDIRAFLEKEFPPETLPSVDEAKDLVAAHRKAREDFAKGQRDGRKLAALKAAQVARREKVEAAQAAIRALHRADRVVLAQEQLSARRAQKAKFLAEMRRIKEARAAARPSGLAAFLGRVTGVSFVLSKLHKHRDARRHAAFIAEKAALIEKQRAAQQRLAHRHTLQSVDMAREVRALEQVEKRERKSYEVAQRKEERVRQRQSEGQMPSVSLALKPRGRPAAPHKAVSRYASRARAKADKRVGSSTHREAVAVAKRESAGDATLVEAFGRASDMTNEGADQSSGRRGEQDGGRGEAGDTRAQSGGRKAQQEAPAMPDPHWTELPLADKFRQAARDRDDVSDGDSRGRRLRPSRSARSSEKDGDERDFERKRER